MVKRWIISDPVSDLTSVAHRWRVPPLVAQLLMNRGVSVEESADSFLVAELANLYPPKQLEGTVEAAELIVRAIRRRSKIVLYGDYDVDGTTGVAILWHVLHQAEAHVSFYVPHRIEEGYGLNAQAVRRLIEEETNLIITVDCGITAIDAAEQIATAGVELIITDHHAPRDTLPRASAIVHPTVNGPYPNPHLSGSGVAFKLAWAIAQQLSGTERVDAAYRDLLMRMLPLAALGTIADVVPLAGENRILAKHGLAALAGSTLPGLAALIDSSGLRGQRVSGSDVGFKLGPRINAVGRMGHARLAVELFTTASNARAQEIALYLEEHNRARQALERKICKQAVDMVELKKLDSPSRRAIVLASPQWHAGVIGIVASRITARYRRPTVMISLSNDQGQGSARSIPHFDLSQALDACKEHLLSFGGHAMAAGLRIAAEKIEVFTEAFVRVANNRLTGRDLVETLRIDATVALEELTLPTVEAVAHLEPFGMGNPRPILVTDWVELASEPRCVGGGQEHLLATFGQNGTCIRAIGFGLASHIEDLKEHRRCRVAFEPLINEFHNRRSVEMKIMDLHFA